MDRKSFLKSCGIFGMGSCVLPGLLTSVQEDPKLTPCEEKEEFSRKWVKRFFTNFDTSLDTSTRKEIMEKCGKSCFEESLEGRKIVPIETDTFIDAVNKSTGEIAAVRDGNVIDFRYVGNPRGLKIADGYCLCPLVESGPEGLSPTYCYCSVGYVKEMFKAYTGKEVSVELVESLKRGDKNCRFRITLIT